MGKWVHRVTERDKETRRGVCSSCGPVTLDHKGLCKRSQRRWKQSRPGVYNIYRQHKGDRCSRCGWIPDDPVQLDVDHKDGDRNNNGLDNLQTLCANCHRLKTLRPQLF